MKGYKIVCRNKSSILLDYIELRIRLNSFEMFVSRLIHEKNTEDFTVIEEILLSENHVNIESKSLELTIYLYRCYEHESPSNF